jgi:hypothetical protein
LRPGLGAAGPAATQAGLLERLRRLHQAILAHFAGHSGSPSPSWLRNTARQLGADPDAAWTELPAADLVHLDRAGRVAYPFSGVATGHRIRLDGGPPTWAMCAIDALGIPQMTGRDAIIAAADPHNGDPIRVAVTCGQGRWSPPAAIVLTATAVAEGTAAACSCRTSTSSPAPVTPVPT